MQSSKTIYAIFNDNSGLQDITDDNEGDRIRGLNPREMPGILPHTAYMSQATDLWWPSLLMPIVALTISLQGRSSLSAQRLRKQKVYTKQYGPVSTVYHVARQPLRLCAALAPNLVLQLSLDASIRTSLHELALSIAPTPSLSSTWPRIHSYFT